MENRSEMAECLCDNSGCGCNTNSSISNIITVSVTPTTGGQFQLSVAKSDSIENLKKLISKKLKVPKERICLLYRERQLREGTVEDNQLVDGSRLTLLPSVETGLLAQRPEQSVMQALESLNDAQVNDFLSGKAPLNLTMRLGDHMMLIQLQLSTVAPGPTTSSSSSSSQSSSSSSRPSGRSQCDCSTQSQTVSGSRSLGSVNAGCRCSCTNAAGPTTVLDTRALAEASRNLTQTLKQLSSEVLTSKSEHSSHEGVGRRQGAIIESMHHHGKGVYSGTFSGTLNPALQDKFGRPKRDISTIIHILNDLLCATPQYRAVQQGTSTSSSSGAVPSSSSQLPPTLSTHGGVSSSLDSSGSGGSHGNTSLCSGVQPRSLSPSSAGVSSPLSAPSATAHLTSSSNVSPQQILPNSRLSADNSEVVNMDPQCTEESQENRATRGKMERLRLVLGQRRERRRAMRARPYATPAPSNPSGTPHPTPPTPDSVTA